MSRIYKINFPYYTLIRSQIIPQNDQLRTFPATCICAWMLLKGMCQSDHWSSIWASNFVWSDIFIYHGKDRNRLCIGTFLFHILWSCFLEPSASQEPLEYPFCDFLMNGALHSSSYWSVPQRHQLHKIKQQNFDHLDEPLIVEVSGVKYTPLPLLL